MTTADDRLDALDPECPAVTSALAQMIEILKQRELATADAYIRGFAEVHRDQCATCSEYGLASDTETVNSITGTATTGPGYLVILGFVILVLWGPVDHNWPFWLAIRTSYLVLIPCVLALLLKYLWRRWQPDFEAEDRLKRTVAGAVGGALFVGAVAATQATEHFECTQTARTRDGYECVGDYVPVPGPDWQQAVFLVAIGTFAIWMGAQAPNKGANGSGGGAEDA
jgi:hypothetical protein